MDTLEEHLDSFMITYVILQKINKRTILIDDNPYKTYQKFHIMLQ